jgi:acetoin utilization deacetylase AcuC-like enzyme
MSTGLHLDLSYADHETGLRHPESPERIRAVAEALEFSGARASCVPLPGRSVTNDDLRLVHAETYLATVIAEVDGSSSGQLSTGDTNFGPHSLEVARAAVGGALAAVDAVVAGTVSNAFCALRPPGHHATADRGMGFCLFNNAAIAARYAQQVHGLERVVIIDWDVHHGNGTQDIFYEDPSVFYFSTHQHPWYPGSGLKQETGRGRGEGSTLNVPLPSGSGMAEIGAAFRGPFFEKMATFRPDLVIISAGFDSRQGDPLGQFTLTDADFAELTKLLLELAEKSAAGRLVSLLEGGYSLTGLASAVASHVGALQGTANPPAFKSPPPRATPSP